MEWQPLLPFRFGARFCLFYPYAFIILKKSPLSIGFWHLLPYAVFWGLGTVFIVVYAQMK